VAFAGGALVLAMIAAKEPMIAAGAAMLGVFGLVVAIIPDAAVAVVVFLLYSNIAVVAVRFHGAPKITGVAIMLLLSVPLLSAAAGWSCTRRSC
jgi:hypothetical protein